YVSIADSPSLRPTNLTVEGWFNFSSLPSDVLTLFGKAVGTSFLDSYAVWYESGALRACIGNTANFAPIAYGWTPVLNTWYHVAFTFDDTTNSEVLYVNGQQVASGSSTLSVAYDTHALLLGA